MKTAVILAAGMGTRFKSRTKYYPKCFLPFGNRSIIERILNQLTKLGYNKIIIGTGYKSDHFNKLIKRYPIINCRNDFYKDTESMYTLYNCRNQINSGFLLLESDIIFAERAISILDNSGHPDIIISVPPIKFQDQYFVEIDKHNHFLRCFLGCKKNRSHYSEWTGISKVSYKTFKAMCDFFEKDIDNNLKLSYDVFMQKSSNYFFQVHLDKQLIWYEIDDEKDLCFAQRHIAPLLETDNKKENA